MNTNQIVVFIMRVALGLAGGWFLTAYFLTEKGQPVSWAKILFLAALVVLAAYLSEIWRNRKGGG